jgi:hypothetical protein
LSSPSKVGAFYDEKELWVKKWSIEMSNDRLRYFAESVADGWQSGQVVECFPK